MKSSSIAAFVLALAVLAADVSSVVGQVTPLIGPGSRVRLTAPSLGLSEAIGTVQEATDEALVVQFEFPARVGTVDRSEIAEMDVLIGRERRGLQGLGVGFLAGAGAGALIGLVSGDDDRQQWFSFTAEQKAGIFAGFFGVIGGVVGMLTHHEVWSPALPGAVDLTVLPLVRERAPALHVGLALRFQ